MQSIAVVGGGIIGMSAAWRLAQAGFRVALYEKHTIGGEASWAGAGMLAPGGEFDHDTKLARLAVAARDLYRAFIDELQCESALDIDFEETGALDVAYSADHLTHLEARSERQRALGIPSKRISPQQAAIFWPRLNPAQFTGGYFYPGDGFVDPRQVVSALRQVCAKAGVALSEHAQVKALAVQASSVLLDGRRHDAVVVAGGAWSGLIPVSGVPALPACEPVRGHLLGYRQPPQTCHTILRHRHAYLLQRANGLLIVGASQERVGFDRRIDQTAVDQLRKEAAAVLPHLAEITPDEVWNGFRPASDELHIGMWHSPRLYLAYGHYRNGILLAPLTARMLADEISANLRMR